MKKQLLFLLACITLLVVAQSPQRFNQVIVTKDITSPKFIRTNSTADSVLLGNGGAKAINTIVTDTSHLSARINAKVSFPGFGTTHITAAYGDHNHDGVYQPVGNYSTHIFSNTNDLDNVMGSNHGDETLSSIKAKLGAASASSAGYLQANDWSTFNSKQSAITGITSNSVLKWDGSIFTNSLLSDDGSRVGIGTSSPTHLFSIFKNSTSNASIDFPCVKIYNTNPNLADDISTWNTSECKIASGYGGAGNSGIVVGGIWTSYSSKLNGFQVGSATSSDVNVVMADTTVARFNHLNANLGIGYLSGTEINTYKLAVNGTGYFSNTLWSKSKTNGMPATSGTSQLNAGFRTGNINTQRTLDFGTYNVNGAWIQSTNWGDLASNYDLMLNPNGGNVSIGYTTTVTDKLSVNGAVLATGFKTQTGTSSQVFTADGGVAPLPASGIGASFTPTFSNLVNLASVTQHFGYYTNVGGIITATINLDYVGSGTGSQSFYINLPVTATVTSGNIAAQVNSISNNPAVGIMVNSNTCNILLSSTGTGSLTNVTITIVYK